MSVHNVVTGTMAESNEGPTGRKEQTVSEVGSTAAGEPLKVALLGCGVVGSSVARMLTEQAGDLTARVGRPLELIGIAVRRAGRDRSDLPVDPSLFTTDAESLVTRADIVIEVIGGIEPARSLILTAMEHGMPPMGGMGMGIDRLLMAITGLGIRETILFPLVK